MRSRRQVLKKLAERGCCALTLEMVAQRLEENGLIDDAAYAQRQLELSNRRGKGQRAAVSALISKGVDADTARRSLEGWDVDAERRAACEAAYKYMRRRWDDDERRARMLTYGALARRGYSSEIARQAVEHAAHRLRDAGRHGRIASAKRYRLKPSLCAQLVVQPRQLQRVGQRYKWLCFSRARSSR